MGIKAVLFDMDGVLIEAKDWHYDALNVALEMFGYRISRESHLSTFDGLPTRRKLQMLTNAGILPAGIHELINSIKQKYTQQIVAEKCRPRFDHRFALSRLKQDGYATAVCSNSVRQSIVNMMGKAGLAPYMDLLVSNEDVKKPKPDPEMYTYAMAQLGVKPEETVILEDNEHGIAAARASGAHVLEVVEVSDVNYANISGFIASLGK